jgi:hypothetical protein
MALRVILAMAAVLGAAAQTPVPTAQYDNARTGANTSETALTPKTVGSSRFGQQWTWSVDGDVYAQPLYVPRVEIPGKGVHDVVFVATEHDSVYAFDASAKGGPLWKASFLGPGVETVSREIAHCHFLSPEIGITSTPAIDLASRTMYVLARTVENQRAYQRLHALDLATGAERPGSPVLIRASVKVPAWFGLTTREVAFNALMENPRAALLVANGRVYLSWGSSCDVGPYYGWVLAYDARSLQQVGVFNTGPDGGESGIWQSDAGIAADSAGNVYAVTGNGAFTAASGGRDYGDSALKLGFGKTGFGVLDYFTPFDQARLSREDLDLGSSGPVLLPGGRLVVTGKAGKMYLIDQEHMGGFRADSDAHAVQTIAGAGGGFGAPAYWNGRLYFAPRREFLKVFPYENGRLGPARTVRGAVNNLAGLPVVSANGNRDGIVWITAGDGTLYAYDALNPDRTLYSGSMNASQLHFATPTVAGGRVYVGMRRQVVVFGLE